MHVTLRFFVSGQLNDQSFSRWAVLRGRVFMSRDEEGWSGSMVEAMNIISQYIHLLLHGIVLQQALQSVH